MEPLVRRDISVIDAADTGAVAANHRRRNTMSTAAVALNDFSPELPVASRARSALMSLMQMWEQDHGSEEPESETDLMVMLSGMVGSYATSLDEQ
jgi:hypothetical protein